MNTKDDTPKLTIPLPSQNYQLLMQMIDGYRISQMIHTAAKLGIADLVSDGPKTYYELAEATGAHAPSLYRLLRTLASLEVFAEDDQGRFSLTPLAELLRTGSNESLHDWAIFSGDEQLWPTWEQLAYSVRTGETSFSHVWGMQNWEYRVQNPQANKLFNAAMTSASFGRIGPVIAAYDFTGIQTIVDVGGGRGTFIATILQYYSKMRGILFDLPHVVEGAENTLQKAGVASRCEILGGSFLDSVPAGGDAYLLSKVIHDWDDDQSILIIKRCRQVMKIRDKLLLVETVIPPGNTPHPGKITDIHIAGDEFWRARADRGGISGLAGGGRVRIDQNCSRPGRSQRD